MSIYSHIEERYCMECERNVGIEYTHMEDGTVIKRCLNKSCAGCVDGQPCLFNTGH